MVQMSSESRFQTTMWSVVLRAGGAEEESKNAALDLVCRTYWRPLFVYCLSKGLKVEDAEDLTQAFFTRLLSVDVLRVADPARGRFRAFLLTSFKRFIADEGDRGRSQKRGGGVVHLPLDPDFRMSGVPAQWLNSTPERAFDKQWAMDLVGRATETLRAELETIGKGSWYELILGPAAGLAYGEVAQRLATSEDAVKSFAKRSKRRFREILENEIADTVSSPEDVADEMAYLVELLRG